jgi:hypothetical protein
LLASVIKAAVYFVKYAAAFDGFIPKAESDFQR